MRRSWQMAFTAALGAALLLPATACKKSETESRGDIVLDNRAGAVRVVDIDLGRSIGADKRVSDKTDRFAPSDQVYASVVLNGNAQTASLRARWTFEDGQVVEETTVPLTPAGETVTEFHIAKPDGLPKGKYKVEFFLDGASVGSEEFEVR